MGRFCDYDNMHLRVEQNAANKDDSLEESISDEDGLAPTDLSLACSSSKFREKDIKIEDHNEASTWNEVLREADELAYIHNEPPSGLFISSGSRRNRSGNKLRFSIRSDAHEGSWSCALRKKTENSYIGEKEVLSRQNVPHNRAPETMMIELLENLKEETDDLPVDYAPPNRKAKVSVAELLEDLQDRCGSSLRQVSRAKEQRASNSSSGRKALPLLGERILDSDDPLEYMTGETATEEEDIQQNLSCLANKEVKGHTMTDLFQEAFHASNMEESTFPMIKLRGTDYYGRLQQIMQMEKDRHLEFLRRSSRGQGSLSDSRGITVQILSRSLEGKLTVCQCLFKEDSHFSVSGKDLIKGAIDGSTINRSVIFSSKICDNVDLVVGNVIHIYPPWKEVLLKDGQKVILCTYFSHHTA